MQTYKIDFLNANNVSIGTDCHPSRCLSDAIAQSGSKFSNPEAAFIKIIAPTGENVLFVNPDYQGEISDILESVLDSKENLIEKHKAQEQIGKKEEEERRKEEEERMKEGERRTQGVVNALKKEIDSGNDYLGITSGLRNDAERMSSAILKRNLDDWSSHESELIRTVNSFPERQRYFSLISETKKLSEEAEGGNDKHILAELKKLNGLMETLVQGQGKQIGMSKDNQNAAKIGIAAHLLTGGTAGAVARGIEDASDSDEE